jgi:hypothetical protein
MNTATQLLERCKDELKMINLSPYPFGHLDFRHTLIKDIEAYLAKQQVEPIPEGYFAALKYQTALFTPEENLTK